MKYKQIFSTLVLIFTMLLLTQVVTQKSVFAQDDSQVFVPFVTHNGGAAENESSENDESQTEIESPDLSIVDALGLPKQTFAAAAGSVRFAVIGDFGKANQVEQNVADMIDGKNVDFVATVGDNVYAGQNDGSAWDAIDNKIGQYYHEYIYPYLGAYGAGSADQLNHFFPLLGNHDYGHGGDTDIPLLDCVADGGLNACSQDQGAWYDYFDLPGNERTYSVTQGAVEIFLFSDYYRDADWAYNENNNVALQTVKNGLLNSTATWKVVLLHFPPYVSASGVNFGAENNRRFDFEAWGADAVIAGHNHIYERLEVDGFPYFVNGTAGSDNGWNNTLSPHSKKIVAGMGGGAMIIDADTSQINFQYFTSDGVLHDSLMLQNNNPPANNLFQNGSFEIGAPDEWDIWLKGGTSAAATITTDSGTFTEGVQSVKVSVSIVTGTEWHIAMQQDQFAVTNGQEYCLAFDIKATSPGDIKVEVMRDVADWRKIGLNTYIPVSTNWNRVELPFTATETQSNTRLNLSLGQQIRTFWFDDMVLAEGNCTAPPLNSGEYVWGQVPIGGGGYITGVEIHPNNPNLVYLRTDVGGAYRWDPATDRLIQLLEREIPYQDRNLWGIESLALAPTNQNTLYVAAGAKPSTNCDCDILKSTDQGNTWTAANLTGVRISGNAVGRWSGERLVVDPNNSNILFFASRYDGLWQSTSASSPNSWSKINDPDFNYAGAVSEKQRGLLSFVAFDPTSGNGTSSQTIYVGAFGQGVYRSTDGGATFSLLNNSPVEPERGVVASDGTLYVTHLDGVSKFDGSWVSITPPGGDRAFSGLDVYKGNANTLVVAERDEGKLGNNRVYRSTDGGSTWSVTDKNNVSFDLNQTWGSEQNWSSATADLAIDPTDSKRIWLTSWFGAWRTDDITAAPRAWKPIEDGHEELVTHVLISPSSGANLISGVADQGGFRHTDPLLSAPGERLEDSQLPAAGRPRIQDTEGLDWAENNPDLIVRVGSRSWNNAPQDGQGQYSTNNGQTWTPFATTPQNNTAEGGVIAMSADGTHSVWIPVGGKPYTSSAVGNTALGDDSWPQSTGTILANLIHSRWAPKKILAADRVINQHFYLLDYSSGKFYRSTNGGGSWDFTSNIAVNSGLWDIQSVKASPETGGDVWVSSAASGLFRSCSGGDDFTKIANVQNAISFGFGAPLPGTTAPTLFLYGRANGDTKYGIYTAASPVCNQPPTWQHIMGDWTLSNGPKALVGDRQIHGRLYIGTGGNGIYYGDLQVAPPTDRATQIEPTGTINTTSPIFKWSTVSGATEYALVLYNVTTDSVMHYETHSAAEAGCSGGGICTIQLGISLSSGSYTWLVQARNNGGNGPWSIYP